MGGESEEVPLGPLNVVIGPNGSGKSNLFDAIELLKAAPAPRSFREPISDGGGVHEWLWKGGVKSPVASVAAVIDQPSYTTDLRYCLSFTEKDQRFELVDESVEDVYPSDLPYSERPMGMLNGIYGPVFHFSYQGGNPVLNVKGEERILKLSDFNPTLSILAQRKDPDQYPEITYLSNTFPQIYLYRE